MSFLLDKGACVHVNSKNRFEETPLYLTLERVLNSTDRFKCVKLLLKNGANPNTGCGGKSPLGKAVEIQDVMSANLLLQHGAKPQLGEGYHQCLLPLHRLFNWRNSQGIYILYMWVGGCVCVCLYLFILFLLNYLLTFINMIYTKNITI